MKIENPTDCPYYLITRVALQMTSAFKRSFIAAGVGNVKPAYLGVLWCLWREEGVKVVELGRCSGLEPSTMTGLLDRMERDGLVFRKADPDDRRAFTVHLTESGRKVQKTVARMINETLQSMLEGIPENEIDRLKEVLVRILSNAREQTEY